jgi:hypothetical protein
MLIPSALDNTTCVLPSRFDSAVHHFSSGGYAGFRESYDKSTSRLLAFQNIFHSARAQLDVSGPLAALFESERYKERARAVCGADKSLFDHIQLGVIVQVPGQEVASHLDVPWFRGATRFNIPQWLLVVMESSGLFQHLRVPQIQGVAYLHSWPARDVDGGGFYFYPDPVAAGNSKDYVVPAVHPPIPNSAIVLDGSVVAHGTTPYRDNQFAAQMIKRARAAAGDNSTAPYFPQPPLIKKGYEYQLRFRKDTDDWAIHSPFQTAPERVYRTEDLRISLVWRSRCFRDEADRADYVDASTFSTEGVDPAKIRSTPLSARALTVEGVLNTLMDDMRTRGLLTGPRPAPLDLALLLVKTYVKYPMPVPISEGLVDAFENPQNGGMVAEAAALKALPFGEASAWGFLPNRVRRALRKATAKANWCLAHLLLEGSALQALQKPLETLLDPICNA